MNSPENPENMGASTGGAKAGGVPPSAPEPVTQDGKAAAPEEMSEAERLEFAKERAEKLSRVQRESYGWGRESGSPEASSGSAGRLLAALGVMLLLWLLFDKFFRK